MTSLEAAVMLGYKLHDRPNPDGVIALIRRGKLDATKVPGTNIWNISEASVKRYLKYCRRGTKK